MNALTLIKSAFFIYLFVSLINVCSNHRAIDYIRAFFTLIFSMFFLYFIHVFQHKYNNSMYGKIHTEYHHNPKCKHKWYATLIELYCNLQLLIFILVNNLIKKLTNIEIFSNYILVFWSLVYTWTHTIDYHNHDSNFHAYHHKFDNDDNINHSSEIKNYGPVSMDMIFNTYHHCTQNKDLMMPARHLMKFYLSYYVTSLIFKIKNNGFKLA